MINSTGNKNIPRELLLTCKEAHKIHLCAQEDVQSGLRENYAEAIYFRLPLELFLCYLALPDLDAGALFTDLCNGE